MTHEQNENENEKIKNIKDRVIKRHHPNASTLSMERVPKDIVEVFKRFANDEFVGDYGLCLKYLVTKVLIEPLPFEGIYLHLEDHEKRLSELEGKGGHKVRKFRRLSGKVTEMPVTE